MRIVVVDPSRTVLKIVTRLLEAGEHEILTIDLYRWLLKRVGSLTDKRQTPIMHGPPSLAPFPVALVK